MKFKTGIFALFIGMLIAFGSYTTVEAKTEKVKDHGGGCVTQIIVQCENHATICNYNNVFEKSFSVENEVSDHGSINQMGVISFCEATFTTPHPKCPISLIQETGNKDIADNKVTLFNTLTNKNSNDLGGGYVVPYLCNTCSFSTFITTT